MDQEPDVIRQQIDETRSSLTEKLETLEGQVRGSVREARETVEGTIQSVKSTVNDTVESVKRTFDVRYQTENHPWAMVGGSVAAGFLLGSLAGIGSRPARRWGGGPRRAPAAAASLSALAAPGPRTNGSSAAPPAPEKPSLLSKLMTQFEPEIDQLKGAAIGALVGVLRDYAKQALPPSLSGQIESVMNSATTKLGGQPVHGPVIQPGESEGARAGEARRSAY